MTVRAPKDPTEYAMLRAAVVRALSSETLPRGSASGPIAYGDSTNGYTLAYVFRLPDPKARGRRRNYAFLALAGQDDVRAFRAFPAVSAVFAKLAEKLINEAERFQEEERKKEERANEAECSTRKYTPVSSFLTHRVVDAHGLPRRVGQTLPRSLAEITGNPDIFAEIHRELVLLLFTLGQRFKMLPRDESLACETLVRDDGHQRAFRSRLDQRGTEGLTFTHSATRSAEIDKLRDMDTTPTPAVPKVNIETAFSTKSLNGQPEQQNLPKTAAASSSIPCSPLPLDPQRRQLMV